jgi:hypothetical protein
VDLDPANTKAALDALATPGYRARAPSVWIDHQTQQRRASLALDYAQRLRWLEDAKAFCAMALGAARRKRPPPKRA